MARRDTIILTKDGPALVTQAQAKEMRRYTCAECLAWWTEEGGPPGLGREWVLEDLAKGKGLEYFGASCTITDPENWDKAVAEFRAG